jgi:hypothetical protein
MIKSVNATSSVRFVPRGAAAGAAATSSNGTSASSNGSAASHSAAVAGAAVGASSQGGACSARATETAAYADTPIWREMEAYVRSLQLHEQPQANTLLQCLVVDMLHRAVAAANGDVSRVFNHSVSAAEAGETTHTTLTTPIAAVYLAVQLTLHLFVTASGTAAIEHQRPHLSHGQQHSLTSIT